MEEKNDNLKDSDDYSELVESSQKELEEIGKKLGDYLASESIDPNDENFRALSLLQEGLSSNLANATYKDGKFSLINKGTGRKWTISLKNLNAERRIISIGCENTEKSRDIIDEGNGQITVDEHIEKIDFYFEEAKNSKNPNLQMRSTSNVQFTISLN